MSVTLTYAAFHNIIEFIEVGRHNIKTPVTITEDGCYDFNIRETNLSTQHILQISQ